MKKIIIGLAFCTAIFFIAACGNQESANIQESKNTEKKTMDKAENNNENTIFGKGEKAPADYFTGTVYVQPMAPKNNDNGYSVANVTFEAGARSNWHSHPAGQTLLVINGTGLYQEKGKAIRTIEKGETIVCDPNIEHWHGASPTSGMTHVAITNFKDGENVVWLKPVTDEEYKAE